MKPLQELIRDSVAPVLKSRGFKRSAGTFRAVTDRGAAVIVVSGRGSTGTYDIECTVDVGFAPKDYFEAAQSCDPKCTAEGIDITDTYRTFHTRMRDPGRTAMDSNATWRFNQDDAQMTDLMTTVLTTAADDVLARLQMWPEVPVDSLSHNPVFSVPVERETRSRWRSNAHGELDLHYASTVPVVRRRGLVASAEFWFDLLHDDNGATIQGGMIQVDPDAVGLLTGDRPMAEWAQSVGLLSMSGYAAIPLTPAPSHVRLIVRDQGSSLLIEPGQRHPGATLDLGHFVLPTSPFLDESHAQIMFIAGDPNCLHQLTFRTRHELANEGRAWWATLPVTRRE